MANLKLFCSRIVNAGLWNAMPNNRLLIILRDITMNGNEQDREALFNNHPRILKKEPVIKMSVANPDAVFSMTVQEYFDRGNAKIEQQDFEGATDYFSRAIELSSENSMVYIRVFRNT